MARKRWKVFGNIPINIKAVQVEHLFINTESNMLYILSSYFMAFLNVNYSYNNFKLKSTFENIMSRSKSQYLDLKHTLNPKIKYIDSNDYSHFDYAAK